MPFGVRVKKVPEHYQVSLTGDSQKTPLKKLCIVVYGSTMGTSSSSAAAEPTDAKDNIDEA